MEKGQDNFSVRITEPTVVAPVGKERSHVASGEVVTVPAEDAYNLVQSGKGVIVEGELPNALKQASAAKK